MRHGHRFGIRLSLVIAAVLAASSGPSSAVATEPTLLGCWRSQQVQLTFADRQPQDQNSDCVIEYESTRIHSRCQKGDTVTDNFSGVEYISPGHMRVTPLDKSTGKPTAASVQMDYRFDGDWLIATRPLDAQPHDASKPVRFTALSVRVDVTREACKPHGETGLRIGRTPVSSIALSVPAGWEAWLVDPANDQTLAAAINTNFFVGAFVPTGALEASGKPASSLFVVDEVRYGPTPVRAAEFANVRQSFAREMGEPKPNLGAMKSTCNRPDRACGLLRMHEGRVVYSELVNVRGRVVMISITASDDGHEEELRRNVQTFVEQLRHDNP
jgi:hypothetical protein